MSYNNRYGFYNVDEHIQVYTTSLGWFLVYIDGVDSTKDEWYRKHELGAQARLIERLGAERAFKILDFLR